MASSSEAFEKFSMWKKSRRPLKVIVIEHGDTSAVFDATRIDALDPEASLVGICFDAIRKFTTFDVGGAEFSIESSRIVATKNKSDWLIFEESE
jgi:hypothetical protein